MTANKRTWLGLLVGGLLLTLPGRALAQQPLQALLAAQKQYPDEKAVYLDYRQDVTVELKGDSVQVLARHHYDMLHLAPQSALYARDKVYSSHFNRLQKLEARTLVPAGNDYKALRISDFKEKFEVQEGIFFDDTRYTTWTFPAVAPGVRTVVDYTVRHPDARFLSPFYFANHVPTRHAEVTLTAPKSVKINYKLFHVENTPVTFTKQEKGSSVVYRWTVDNMPSPSRDDDGPEIAYYAPHLVYYVEEVPAAGQPRKMLSGVPELYSLYSGFVAGLDKKESPALRRVVDSLAVGAASEEERVRRVYYWVQDHVRYVAFENGLRGFVPADAGQVYARRYGDCKDMANLTHEMLRMAGVKSYLTWIGTRALPYRYSELATPGVDNHMIATWEPKPGQYVFLDATSKHNPFNMPTSMIQGKEALLALDGKNCKVVSVPVMDKEKSHAVDVSTLALSGTTLKGKGQLALSGYPKITQAYALDGMDKTEETKYVKRVLERGNNKFFVDSYAVRNVAAREQPLTIDYEYRLQDYVQQVDDEIYLNLNLEQPYANDRIDADKRRLPLYNEYTHSDRTRTEFEIPAGYDVEYLPANASTKEDVLGFSIRYERKGNKIVQEKDLYVNYLLLQPTEFAKWNTVVDKLGAAYRDVIILKKKKV
ncbi:DUF3857 domain-containing protein [Hymenobacter cellulosivorans]|uniref:DUF3857 domain-containing protein n=1 Tax=Hymenobacter cellulosivorans TaxID=2932249 RepID=A0ABY4F9D7_9BACT|nr:transglutaminase domain-containing protein [Hymenobacter cellulosivorans]UOQ53275.1 DUF3857 domain-containing protein [Hymenobacter cellulosivorans]